MSTWAGLLVDKETPTWHKFDVMKDEPRHADVFNDNERLRQATSSADDKKPGQVELLEERSEPRWATSRIDKKRSAYAKFCEGINASNCTLLGIGDDGLGRNMPSGRIGTLGQAIDWGDEERPRLEKAETEQAALAWAKKRDDNSKFKYVQPSITVADSIRVTLREMRNDLS